MTLRLKLRIWRQAGPDDPGSFLDVDAHDIPEDCSFLEMLDIVNERLIDDDIEPITFAHDCREGICGTCGVMINGRPHGPESATATCQLHMRKFDDGDEIVIEPFRAASFPVVKDLMVDRRAFDRIIESGGFISAPTGTAPDANEIPVPKDVADFAMDAAACIGCGACVAACPNSAAQLFTAAKLGHLNVLPQGQPERWRAGRGHGGDDGVVLRVVHQPRRVHRGVPQGDQPRLHRGAQPGLPQGQGQESPPRLPDLTGSSPSSERNACS